MDIEKEKEKIAQFIKVGLVVLSIILVIGLGIQFIPKIGGSNNGKEEKNSVIQKTSLLVENDIIEG
ncbi:hypothetical protein [Anaerosporobacter faecicola]|uniref:hypothetical protein n=1 Tax=Anaerosporobacter faecicola TaxID=2718714 RepID=UPI001438D71B|nr:hypothetical protein [Anaerosporobacter faecicola]